MLLDRRKFPMVLGAPALAAAQASGVVTGMVTLVVPFSAGGSADITAHTLATHAQRLLPGNIRVQVENRPGASGALGTHSVARAVPDGQTLLLARVGSSAILPATDSRTPFAWDEFTFLGLLDENPYVIAVRADSALTTLDRLAEALRDRPGRLRFATSGRATILDLGVRQFFIAAGLELDAANALVLRGGGEAVAALDAGQVDFVGNNLPELTDGLRAGRLRALGVSGAARLPGLFPALAGVPSMREAGYPALETLVGWSALAGPPGLPAPVVALWAETLSRLGEDAAWRAETAAHGSRPQLLDGADARAFVGEQVEMYRTLARRLGLA